MEINRFSLQNGLRVVHCHMPSTTMVAVNTLFNVGARDESPQLTGMAHLFEHLMFGGSVNIPDFDAELSAAGGMSNAWTSNDFTNFYDILPARNIETALWLESDRMLSLGFNDHSLDVQKKVVIEEFKQVCLNTPYGDMDHAFRRAAYKRHPYRWPVIGKNYSHISKVTMDDVRSWFENHYAPGNAVLAIAGNIDFGRVRELVEKWYGDIPERPTSPRQLPVEPLPRKARMVEMDGNVPVTAIRLAWPMAPYGKKGYFEADLISDILANGKASRFKKRLLMSTPYFAKIDAAIQGAEDAGTFNISARLTRNTAEYEQKAIDAIEAELAELCSEAVGERELNRCLTRLHSARTFGMMHYAEVASTIAMAEMHGEHPDDFLRPYRLITPETLRQTAREMFVPHRRIGVIYRPRG